MRSSVYHNRSVTRCEKSDICWTKNDGFIRFYSRFNSIIKIQKSIKINQLEEKCGAIIGQIFLNLMRVNGKDKRNHNH
jgi:hypothetical protein